MEICAADGGEEDLETSFVGERGGEGGMTEGDVTGGNWGKRCG